MKWPKRCPSEISLGRKWRVVAGLVFTFFFLFFVRKEEYLPHLRFFVLGCLFFFKILRTFKMSCSEQVLDYALNPNSNLIFHSKEMQLEEDDRGYFEGESKTGLS